MASKKKNIQQLKDIILNESEELQYVIEGIYETHTIGVDVYRNGILAATNQRVIFFSKRLTGYDFENFDYNRISTFELSKRLTGNKITFYSSGNKVTMKYINDKEINDFVTYVNRKMENEKNSEPQNNLQNDNLSKIKQLKELLDIEAITQEEYEQKKKELLELN
ncbi:PH domain-containing protein [Staphylococcus caprae]|uniref:YokE-like PH domain-containing protein n=1 Tax=Staphylococcus caprae TaxID=29380 RepID=A0ABN5W5T0_9STAP|nr:MULTISPECIES: PH domain-containing protein [Staphylococcus]EES40779.1 hypothetical protein HMPREF0793_1466 [Staphylococcus caprae M23864:W1]MBN6824981.1 PH domain-containing protein [Staphylococcus caprae]MBX5317741.1 PH domain-containing protein [Staphylococcus caprae]MBX5322255.1 hypothetical protein [Staphylococcus caprae]MDI0015097.1 PH domain-containing protein [Staphylococcus caprae]